MARRGRRDDGLTLIELMVVIGIAAVLAAMVVPIFGAVQSRQHISTCASNLKTIGQALLMYRSDYLAFPPDPTEWWNRSENQHGLGLSQLYYGYWAYGRTPPAAYNVAAADYITDVKILHCPRAPRDDADYGDWPYLGGYNVYDWNYRRDRWTNADPQYNVWSGQGPRNLKQSFPPDNTVITWCPMHRANPAGGPGDLGSITSADHDLVLWVDGSVSNFVSTPSRYDQYQAEQPR